jgi:predicted ArsR family transcriptional regulator
MRIEARTGSELHRDVYPVVRVTTEFFLRSFDILGQVHKDMINGLIVMALWHEALTKSQRKAMGVRELSRRLDLPYETVRRHVRQLKLSGACTVVDGGVSVSPGSRPKTSMLRRIYLNAVRLLNDLTRIEVVDFRARVSRAARSRSLDKEQRTIAVAAIGLLITSMRELRAAFGDDLLKGVVFTAIRAANIKHYTNTSPSAHRSILPDVHRLPVSALAISQSLRLPYETVRRHADTLAKEGTCIRVGRRGLIVPESAFRHMAAESIRVHQVMVAFVAELRATGVTV